MASIGIVKCPLRRTLGIFHTAWFLIRSLFKPGNVPPDSLASALLFAKSIPRLSGVCTARLLEKGAFQRGCSKHLDVLGGYLLLDLFRTKDGDTLIKRTFIWNRKL